MARLGERATPCVINLERRLDGMNTLRDGNAGQQVRPDEIGCV
jgi:hypothetical protein